MKKTGKIGNIVTIVLGVALAGFGAVSALRGGDSDGHYEPGEIAESCDCSDEAPAESESEE